MPRKKKEQHINEVAEAQNNLTVHYDVPFIKINKNSEIICPQGTPCIQYFLKKNDQIVDRGSISEGNSIRVTKDFEIAIIPQGVATIISNKHK